MSSTFATIRHRQVSVERLSIHVAECGALDGPSVLFLHGWPEDWSIFSPVMTHMADRHHLAAVDLPGVGLSADVPPSSDKHALAALVNGIINALDFRDVTLVGHDVGGMIAYAYLRRYPDNLSCAVIMDVVVPGVEPWSQVIRNPHIWHFGFHAVPILPELLVRDHIAAYFDFFYDALAGTPKAVSDNARAAYALAYARPTALHTGFEWYRAFDRDAQDNMAMKGQRVNVPILCLRGDREYGHLDSYVNGLRGDGMQNVRGEIIANSGHFAPVEQPEAVAAALERFIDGSASARVS